VKSPPPSRACGRESSDMPADASNSILCGDTLISSEVPRDVEITDAGLRPFDRFLARDSAWFLG
jgi:hypothetical protein